MVFFSVLEAWLIQNTKICLNQHTQKDSVNSSGGCGRLATFVLLKEGNDSAHVTELDVPGRTGDGFKWTQRFRMYDNNCSSTILKKCEILKATGKLHGLSVVTQFRIAYHCNLYIISPSTTSTPFGQSSTHYSCIMSRQRQNQRQNCLRCGLLTQLLVRKALLTSVCVCHSLRWSPD